MHFTIGGDAEQSDGQIIVLLHGQDRRDDHVRAVGPDDEVDLVDFNQLRVDAGNERRIALIVVVDEFDRPSKQPALGVDVVLPDLHREQDLLAVRCHRAGESDTKPIRIGSAAGAGVTAARQNRIAAAAILDNARNRATILIIVTANLPRLPSRGRDPEVCG